MITTAFKAYQTTREEYLNSSKQVTVTTTFNHDAASFLFFFSNVGSLKMRQNHCRMKGAFTVLKVSSSVNQQLMKSRSDTSGLSITQRKAIVVTGTQFALRPTDNVNACVRDQDVFVEDRWNIDCSKAFVSGEDSFDENHRGIIIFHNRNCEL